MSLPRIIIAGTNSGVGKTTITLGIISALKKRGLSVQAFKTGPDYIDPTYHSEASGRICVNLDSWLLSKDAVIELFTRRAKVADIAVIEGVMGLYDGLKDTELGSTAHLAKILKCPVILILDARSMSRSAGAIAFGYKEFDRNVKIAGVILNNIGSVSHYSYIKSAIESKSGIPVLGCLPKNKALRLCERHLGLVPVDEKKLSADFSKKLPKLVEDHIDLGKILKIARRVKSLPRSRTMIFKKAPAKERVTIAVAKDEAFNFYYQDNLDILNHLGARIVTFSPLKDMKLPEPVDGLYIGGGFPELFARDLAKNKNLRQSIKQKADAGMPIYAECGGLMYLVDKLIDFKNKQFPMVGIFGSSVKMGDRLRRMGYVNIEAIKDNVLSKKGMQNRAHLFHWSRITNKPKNASFAYKVTKEKGNEFSDGLARKNVLASYAHLHFASDLRFAKNFTESCRRYKDHL